MWTSFVFISALCSTVACVATSRAGLPAWLAKAPRARAAQSVARPKRTFNQFDDLQLA
jgi:hypothetical protein